MEKKKEEKNTSHVTVKTASVSNFIVSVFRVTDFVHIIANVIIAKTEKNSIQKGRFA